MPTTIVSAKSHRVRIAPGRKTVAIGDRCNTLGSKKIRDAVAMGAWDKVVEVARKQFDAGAQILDVNMVGMDIPEKVLLPMAVAAIRSSVDAPLAIDFGDPEALDLALEKAGGRCLVNSISGEQEKLETVMPIARKHGAAMVALLCDDDGIPATPEGRLWVANAILDHGTRFGFTLDDFLFDCIATGVATDVDAGACTLATIDLVRRELGANMTLGASNVSFGMPRRRAIDAHYLALAIARGVNAPMTDVTNEALRWAMLTTDAIMGKDKLGIRFIRETRKEDRGGSHG